METRRRALRKTNDADASPRRVRRPERRAKKSWFQKWSTRCFYGTFFASLSIAIAVMCASFFLPDEVVPQSYSLPMLRKLDMEMLRADFKLPNALRLLPDELMAPESIVLQEDRIYTGTADGKVVEIVGGRITQKINMGTMDCKKLMDIKNCGRPLGMRTIGDRVLLVADAQYGLCEVDFNKKSVKPLLPPQTTCNGKAVVFYNDLDILDDVVYFTHSSQKWNVDQYIYISLSGIADGRLIRYNRTSGDIQTIIDHLFFPNGVQVSKDQKYLYVAETGMARILRLKLSEMPNPKVDYLVENLPCLPDNIRLSNSGDNIWVACAAVRVFSPLPLPTFRESPQYDWFGRHPEIRKYIIKFVPRRILIRLVHILVGHYGMALLLDNNGNYVKSFHDEHGKAVSEVSEIADNGTHLLLGSYRAHGLSCLPI